MKNSLNRITNRQYLLDITLVQFSTNYSQDQAKIVCELHYDQNHVKFRNIPLLKNKIADFEQQKITIPFSIDVALVFRQIKTNKTQEFLGHHQLQIQEYLKDGRWAVKTRQKLQQTQSWVEFQCKIVDKMSLEDSSLDQISQDDNMRKSQFSVILDNQTQINMQKRPFTYRANSQISPYNQLIQSFTIIKSLKNLLLPQQFQKNLHQAEEIIYKKNLQQDIQTKLQQFKRDGRGCLKTQKVLFLQKELLETKRQVKLHTLLIYFSIAISSFFLGMIFS